MTDTHPVALVSGGSAGIGEDICRHLLDAGYLVLNLSRRPAAIDHERLLSFEIDLADVSASGALIAELADHHRITSIVHNAGVIRPALIEEVHLEDLEYLLVLNGGRGKLLHYQLIYDGRGLDGVRVISYQR